MEPITITVGVAQVVASAATIVETAIKILKGNPSTEDQAALESLKDYVEEMKSRLEPYEHTQFPHEVASALQALYLDVHSAEVVVVNVNVHPVSFFGSSDNRRKQIQEKHVKLKDQWNRVVWTLMHCSSTGGSNSGGNASGHTPAASYQHSASLHSNQSFHSSSSLPHTNSLAPAGSIWDGAVAAAVESGLMRVGSDVATGRVDQYPSVPQMQNHGPYWHK